MENLDTGVMNINYNAFPKLLWFFKFRFIYFWTIIILLIINKKILFVNPVDQFFSVYKSLWLWRNKFTCSFYSYEILKSAFPKSDFYLGSYPKNEPFLVLKLWDKLEFIVIMFTKKSSFFIHDWLCGHFNENIGISVNLAYITSVIP